MPARAALADGTELVLSVVSHGQRDLLLRLLEDLKHNVRTPFRLIVTENIPEPCALDVSAYPYGVEIVQNDEIKGFASNHNAALERAGKGLFCVLNPDIRLPTDPFPNLLPIAMDPRVGVAAPTVVAADMTPEDHARPFPNVFTLASKLFGRSPRTIPRTQGEVFHPDWIAGMFMLFRTKTLRALHGFDARYFLYYEDVDLCARIREAGLEVSVCMSAYAIHHARRESRRNLRYLIWHVRSVTRFFVSRPGIALGLRSRPNPRNPNGVT